MRVAGWIDDNALTPSEAPARRGRKPWDLPEGFTALRRVPPRVALVHHWLVTRRGGERVLAELCRIFPDAPIFTLFGDGSAMPEPINQREVRTSVLNPLRRWHDRLAPLFPLGVRSLDLRGFDLVLSSDAACMKGVTVDRDAVHLCYCYAPMRWAFDFPETYLRAQLPALLRPPARLALRALRAFDRSAAIEVGAFATSSQAVRERIRRHYRRDAAVLPPPVDLDFFTPAPAPQSGQQRGAEYLWAGQLVPYKRPDLAVAAFSGSGRRLLVAGDGPLRPALERVAGPEVQFLGAVTDDELRRLYRTCRALIFPGEEDFGLVPLEAMACGLPVLALGAGGALETVRGLWLNEARAELEDGLADPTGIFLPRAEVGLLRLALEVFEREADRFREQACIDCAAPFAAERFREQVRSWVGFVTGWQPPPVRADAPRRAALAGEEGQ